jgi:hypothetical protein
VTRIREFSSCLVATATTAGNSFGIQQAGDFPQSFTLLSASQLAPSPDILFRVKQGMRVYTASRTNRRRRRREGVDSEP